MRFGIKQDMMNEFPSTPFTNSDSSPEIEEMLIDTILASNAPPQVLSNYSFVHLQAWIGMEYFNTLGLSIEKKVLENFC